MAGNSPGDHRAEVANMTDEELIDSWETASDKETENLSPFLRAVVEEMDRRRIAFSRDQGGA
ncbi:hypothetical protein Sj15T_36140 [Sphingobium sp. TA15]|uniref:Uncharacterized protein n=2 Tax=Sphingobium indicum TaxID=332055 RepID=D4Z7S0_SPHIU|nr:MULTISPECIES: hypothetical protein [Sphingobium]EPR14980.1 hypothetical protein M527_26745 [Sphingobium indicum IP26]BDD68593.1 hypothetical protein Sj15T_36140 [Sphingobium sp. TA15]EQB02288.1 hypothetical protein L286_14390 [Sphingobium sp. HDIP04]KER35848.1 hypothetical protein AL00_13980 [Sphingobium indicum F2]BAI98539.1 hypothetical protein SJA_C2-01760 [Sphingobium indicum UT26S]